MKTMKFWRSALVLTLALTIMLSVTGGTIAWFTDSVTSANNEIKSGNLDIELEYWNGNTYEKVTTDTKLFKENALWEPGYTEVAYLKVSNAGNLALKYQLGVNVAEEKAGETKDDKIINLSEHLKFAVVESTADLAGTYTRETAQAAAANGDALETSYVFKDMKAGAAPHYLALIICMPESVGNEANHNGTNVPSITLGVKLEATQLAEESDSFNNQYDIDAQFELVPGAANDAYSLEKKLETAKYGDVITLLPGEYNLTKSLTIPAGVTLKGAQAGVPANEWVNDDNAEKTVLMFNTADYAIDIAQTPNTAYNDIVIDGIMINGSGIHTKKSGDGSLCLENIKVINCAVVNAQEGIILMHTLGAVIENNYVENVQNQAIALTNYFNYIEDNDGICDKAPAYIRNNVIKNVTATEAGAIQLTQGVGSVVISDNTVMNVTSLVGDEWSSPVTRAAIAVKETCEDGVITIDNNTIKDVDRGIAIYKFTATECTYYSTATPDESKVVISNNKITNFTEFGIATKNLHEHNSVDYCTVHDNTPIEITDNSFDTATNALQIGQENSGWTVTATGNKLNGTTDNAVNGTFEQ